MDSRAVFSVMDKSRSRARESFDSRLSYTRMTEAKILKEMNLKDRHECRAKTILHVHTSVDVGGESVTVARYGVYKSEGAGHRRQ